jgi:hypothetical protein
MSPKVPSDWRLTWVLVALALGLFGLLVLELADKYPYGSASYGPVGLTATLPSDPP